LEKEKNFIEIPISFELFFWGKENGAQLTQVVLLVKKKR
jgi:hypothetical protein